MAGMESPPDADRGGSQPGFTDEKRDEVLSLFSKRLKASKTHRDEWREEARALYDMAAGRQWDPSDSDKLKDQQRPEVTFNVAGKYMDAVQGLQINNRQDIRYAPRQPGAVKVNEQLTGAVAWGRDLSCMADSETDAFYDCILTGEGWVECYIDRDLEASGVPAGARVDPLEMFPDPTAKMRNYEDAKFAIRLKWYSPDEYREIVGEPDSGQTSDATSAAGIEGEDEDALAMIEADTGTAYDLDRPGGATGASTPRRAIADYQWWEREDAVIVTAQGYGTQVFGVAEWQQTEPMLQQARDQQGQPVQYQVTPHKRKVYYRAIIAGNRIVQGKLGKSPYQKGFTFHSITGKRDRNRRHFYGIGRAILDPQRWVNKFFSTILYTMMSNAKGGLLAEENTFRDPKKAEDEWAKPNSITWLKEGALVKGKLQPKPMGEYPQGIDRLMEFSLAALPQTSGLNLELMGMADRVQAGVVEAQRKQSAMAIIAWAFDAMRRYYRSIGRNLAEYVKDYIPEGTLVMIAGPIGKQYVPLVKSQLNIDYDIIVDEAPTSTNQQERTWAVLQVIIPQLLQAGLSIPPKVLEYAPLPSDLIDEWKRVLQPDPQKQQISEASVQATLKKLIGEVEKTQSETQLNQAKAAQIAKEIQQPPEQAQDPTAKAAIEGHVKVTVAQMKAEIDANIEKLRMNREAETALIMERMGIESEERMRRFEALVDARLKSAEIAANAHSKMAVAAIASGGREVDGKPDPHVEALTKAARDMADAVKELRKPRKHTIKRDKKGDLAEILTE